MNKNKLIVTVLVVVLGALSIGWSSPTRPTAAPAAQFETTWPEWEVRFLYVDYVYFYQPTTSTSWLLTFDKVTGRLYFVRWNSQTQRTIQRVQINREYTLFDGFTVRRIRRDALMVTVPAGTGPSYENVYP
jgi:hypothetical protein